MSKSTQGVESTLTVTFKKKGDDTLMSLQHSGLPSSAGGTSHNAGWKYFLDQLVDHFAVGARRQK